MKQSNFLFIKGLLMKEFPAIDSSSLDGNIFYSRQAQSWVWVSLFGSKNIGRSISKIRSYGLNLDRR
jgi:hypothetical protein